MKQTSINLNVLEYFIFQYLHRHAKTWKKRYYNVWEKEGIVILNLINQKIEIKDLSAVILGYSSPIPSMIQQDPLFKFENNIPHEIENNNVEEYEKELVNWMNLHNLYPIFLLIEVEMKIVIPPRWRRWKIPGIIAGNEFPSSYGMLSKNHKG